MKPKPFDYRAIDMAQTRGGRVRILYKGQIAGIVESRGAETWVATIMDPDTRRSAGVSAHKSYPDALRFIVLKSAPRIEAWLAAQKIEEAPPSEAA